MQAVRLPCGWNRYPVPAGLIGCQVRVLLHASELVACDGRAQVADHERLGTSPNGRKEQHGHRLQRGFCRRGTRLDGISE
jgi:hypothetical protein